MAEETKTNWTSWLQERIGSGSEAPQKSNLKFGRIAWCQAFDRGDQYKILNEETGVVEDVYMTRETRCIYNVCKTFNDAYAAKMWKGNPTPVTRPFSTNTESYDEDVNVATNAAVEYWWKTTADGPIKLYDITRTAAVGGIGVAKEYYDKNRQSGIYTGEIVLEKVNPLHFYYNMDATCDEELREVIHRFPKDKAVAEEEFAEQMKKLGITELEPQSRSDANPETIAASKKLGIGQHEDVKTTVIENDIWVKKSKKYPNGKHVIVIGDHTLVEEDNPEPDKLPFFTYAVNPQDNDIQGLGITYPIIPIQRDMNKNRSIIAENSDTMGHLKWIEKEGSVTNPAAFDDMSGERIQFTGDFAPTQSRVNPIPEYISSGFWDLLEIAKFVTHLQDIGLGTLPKRGSQMSTGTTTELVNSEEVMFAPDKARMVGFVQKIVRRYLFLAKKYYAEDRIVTIVGENKRPEAVTFKAEQLDDNYNVDINVGDGFARSDDAQVTAITQLMQTQAFDKAGVDPRLIMEELLKKMGLVKIKEDTFKDERQAKRYLNLILAGQSAPYSEFINPNAHIKVFTDYIKQPDYDVLDVNIRVGIDRYLKQMVAMTIGQGAPMPPPPNAEPGAPGNEFPSPPAPPQPNMGGRPPMENMDLAASQPAPQGAI